MQVRNRLNAMMVSKTNAPGFYADGGNLYLQIGKSGGKSWIFRYQLNGKTHDLGLGPTRDVGLAEARLRAGEFRQLCSKGIDPLEAREDGERAVEIAAERSITFEQCARAYIDSQRAAWKNDKSATQWESSLRTYAFPIVGALPVQNIDTQLVANVLEPIWTIKTETASRLRGRIEAILASATTRGYRTGDNPARWRGHLQNLLPKPSKVHKAKPHSALPFPEIPAFMAKLRSQCGMAAKALEFIILTAARRREVLEAIWGEIDFEDAVWTVPDFRMKAGNQHKVPLSAPALKLLKSLGEAKAKDVIFPNIHSGAPLSDMAIANLLERMGRGHFTTHGFRSSFRDWISEKTGFQSEVAEMALAHAIADKTEASYRRGDLFEKRRKLMDAWARYCDQQQVKADVATIPRLPLASAKAA